MPIATTSDQFALQASLRDWAKQAAPLAAVRRLEPGGPVPAETGNLSELAGLGLFSIAIPEAAGGAGGTLTDLACALEQLTVALVPGPVLPTALAGLLLASANATAPLPAPAGATALLPALAAGQATAAVALTPGRLAGARQAGGTLRVTGQTGPVLGAGTTSHLLLGATTDDGEAWFWIPADHPALTVTPRRPLDFSRSLADVTLTDVTVPEDQLINGLDTATVRDLAATTCAAEAAGVAAWCCATAADYARTRQADWAIGLARTDPDVPKHQGLTYFLVDMHAPGIDIRPLREITGRTMFNEVFLDEVFVPDDCVLGARGDGWRIAMSTLASERVAIGTGQDEEAQALLAPDQDDDAERTGLHVATAMSIALLSERGAHPAIRKLIGVGHRQAVAGTALQRLGPDGAAESEASGEFLLTRCLSIAGGTTQILLNQVGERVLGLPR